MGEKLLTEMGFERIERYAYKVSWIEPLVQERHMKNGQIGRQADGQVIIEFKNNLFASVSYPFSGGKYTREQWEILSAIESEIAHIEAITKGRTNAA